MFTKLKESNKSRFDSYSVKKQYIDHIPFYLSGIFACTVFPTTFLKTAVYMTWQSEQQPCVKKYNICPKLQSNTTKSTYTSIVYYL